MLSRTICETFCKVLSDNIGTMLEKDKHNEQRASIIEAGS